MEEKKLGKNDGSDNKLYISATKNKIINRF